jgi:hypothetical protein
LLLRHFYKASTLFLLIAKRMFIQRQFTPNNRFFYGNFLCSLAIGFILDVCHAYIGASNVEKNGSCNQCCSANSLIYNLIQDDRLHDYRITASFLNFPPFNRIFMYIFMYINTYIYI